MGDKKKISDFIKFKLVGECDIDVKEVINHFNLCCRIYERNGEYELVEYTPRMETRLFKVTIHKDDALEIINTLDLKPFTKHFLGYITAYVPVGI